MANITRDTAEALQKSLAQILTSNSDGQSTFIDTSPERGKLYERIRKRVELLNLISTWLKDQQLVRPGKFLRPAIPRYTLLTVQVSGDQWEEFKSNDRLISLMYNQLDDEWYIKLALVGLDALTKDYHGILSSDALQKVFAQFVTFDRIVAAWVSAAQSHGLPLPTQLSEAPAGGYALYADRLPTEKDSNWR